MGILTDLLAESEPAPLLNLGNQKPAAKPKQPAAVAQSPRSNSFEVKDAVEIGDGLIRFRRSPALPQLVRAAAFWPRRKIPEYVELCDEVFELAGWEGKPAFHLVAARPRPPWLVFGEPPPSDHLCCTTCGRSLFYIDRNDAERCFTCYPSFVPRYVKVELVDDLPPIAADDVRFFLKPGVGLDW